MKRKGVWLIYDADTALGINNEGELVFSYNLEDIDHVDGSDVFNGQKSVLWINLRQAFYSEIRDMYASLRSSGALSYAKVEKMFDDHQAKWPEKLFNEDEKFKHLDPLTVGIYDADGNFVHDDSYLGMYLGTKKSQRKWWLYNRLRYLDSKYGAGDNASDFIELRGYAKGDIRVTPAIDIYPSAKYGSYMVSTRGEHNVEYTLECPLDNVNDTEIAIYSASQLKKVRGLEALKVGRANFAKATGIDAIILGSSAVGYANTNLKAVTIGSNELLKILDLRNCTNYAQSPDLSGCPNVEEVYLEGTQAPGCVLPVGGVLKKLHLPETVANLTIINQESVTDFVLSSYANLSTVRLENVSDAIPLDDILTGAQNGARLRLVGYEWSMADTDEIAAFCDRLDRFAGLDETGANMEKAQVFVTINIPSAEGDAIAALEARYPGLNIVAGSTRSTLTYASFDGSATHHTETVVDGGNGTWDGQPDRAEDDDGIYTFVGWSRVRNATAADPEALDHVVADRTVYAAYSVVPKIKAQYYDDDGVTLLHTESRVGSGDFFWSGIPTKDSTAQYDYSFSGWSRAMDGTVDADAQKNATTNIKLYAVYSATLRSYTVTFVKASADGGGTYDTQTVEYGSYAEVPATNPIYSGSGDVSDHPFSNWSPDPLDTVVTGNTTFTAVFRNEEYIFQDPGFDVEGAYAVQWNMKKSGTKLIRGGAAADFEDPVPAAGNTGTGSSPFDSIAPWAGMKMYNVEDGVITASQDDERFSFAKDVVVRIPEFWYKVSKNTTNQRHTWAISPTAKEGYKKHPGSGKYVGRYSMTGSASGVFTKTGGTPIVNVTRANCRSYGKAKGANWRMIDAAVWGALQMLYLVEFADFYSQNVLGKGLNTGTLATVGGTDAAKYHTVKVTGAHNQYRYVEDMYSNVANWIDGFSSTNKRAYVSTNPSAYADAVTGYTDTGVTMPASGWILGFACNDNCDWMFIPSNTDSTQGADHSADHVTNYTWTTTDSGVRMPHVGGTFGGNPSYGVFYFSANLDVSATSGSTGSRLLYEA